MLQENHTLTRAPDKRAQLLQLLQEYVPVEPEEQVYKKSIVAFVENNPDCFERSLQIGHITASAWLLSQDRSHVLLMHHAKLNMWVQLGGHCDGDSDVLAVAMREAQEESGIQSIVPLSNAIFDIDIHLIPANKHEQEHYHYDIRFLLGVTRSETIVQNSESKELRWICKDPANLPTESRSIVRMFDKWLKR